MKIKVLLDGLSADTPPSARWQAVAASRLPELDRLIRRAQGMKRILEIFLTDSRTRMDTLRDAVGKDDMKTLQIQSHTLKSSSASLGARRFADLLSELEKAARDKHQQSARQAFEAIDIEYRSVHAALTTEMENISA